MFENAQNSLFGIFGDLPQSKDYNYRTNIYLLCLINDF